MRIDRIDSQAAAMRPAQSTQSSQNAQPPSAPAAPPAARDEFMSAAQSLREAIGAVSRTTHPRFNVNPIDKRVQVEIVDRTSGEVVREIPQEALVRFARSWDAYLGSLVDQDA